MARLTNVKTRIIQRQLHAAGFTLVRNAGGHEIWRNGPDWTRIAAGHREIEANALRQAQRAMDAAHRRRLGPTAA